MQVTLEMIETKEFKTAAKGYDPEEVDNFLDDIMDEMARQLDEIQSLQQQLASAQAAQKTAAVSAYAKPQTNVPDSDFREILEMAQNVKSQTIAKAQEEAAAIVSKAQQEADARMNGLEAERARLADEVESLKQTVANYRTSFETMLEEQKKALEYISEI